MIIAGGYEMYTRFSRLDYHRIEQAILFLDRNAGRQPRLSEIARSVNLSTYHFHRLFRRWAGISPKRFLQILTLEQAKQLLKSSRSLLDVAWEAGLSGSGRLHDLFVTAEAVTPAEFRNRGRNMTLRYGFHPGPFGECMIAATDRGVTNLVFIAKGGRKAAVADLRKIWKNAAFRHDQAATGEYASRIFSPSERQDVALAVRGTNFQIKVWQALLKIPRGKVRSYEQVAQAIGKPGAVRAVANAVARNPVAFLIPCHRVIRKTGALGGYRWGAARKKAMLAWEAVRSSQ